MESKGGSEGKRERRTGWLKDRAETFQSDSDPSRTAQKIRKNSLEIHKENSSNNAIYLTVKCN